MRYNPNGNTVDGCNENCAKKLCEGAGGVWRVKNKEHRKYICQTSRGNIEILHLLLLSCILILTYLCNDKIDILKISGKLRGNWQCKNT